MSESDLSGLFDAPNTVTAEATPFAPSAVEAVRALRERYPDTPFLTLGQTIFWDEPVKAAFCRILEAIAPDAKMMAAVHDTDYFAKLPREARAGDEKFVLLPHNDGSTRSLWSAAGELSCLFGSETVPTRSALVERGVAFDRVARSYPGGGTALLENESNAPGWRALVHTEPHPLIAADVKLSDIAPALRRQLEWGFEESLQILGDVPDSRAVATQIKNWIDEYLDAHPHGTLTDLYRTITPKLWALVRGGGTCNLLNGASTELFRFNRETCRLPRFSIVDLFLNPATRETARRCYDDAVRGSGIYTLDGFGEGALPFDVVIRGRGRGTLRLHESSLYIDTEDPITLCTGCDCTSVDDLAAALEAKFGPDVVLVGKAVSLISMLSAEFIFVFHEKASSYTARTQEMNNCLRAAGMSLDLKPMLRLQHATWDALAEVETVFHLPPHLANAFETETITGRDFAARWQTVCEAQEELTGQLKACHSPRDLLNFLVQHSARQSEGPAGDWSALLAQYDAARALALTVREQTTTLQQEAEAARAHAKLATACAAEIERTKGNDWRARVQPLRTHISDIRQGATQRLTAPGSGPDGKLTKEDRAARTALEQQEATEIQELREQIATVIEERSLFDRKIEQQYALAREAKAVARAKTQERVALERSPEMEAARETIARIEYEAELERLRRTRDAYVTSQGLKYINNRPTAWWFPLVSPDGRWFAHLAATAQARTEDL